MISSAPTACASGTPFYFSLIALDQITSVFFFLITLFWCILQLCHVPFEAGMGTGKTTALCLQVNLSVSQAWVLSLSVCSQHSILWLSEHCRELTFPQNYFHYQPSSCSWSSFSEPIMVCLKLGAGFQVCITLHLSTFDFICRFVIHSLNIMSSSWNSLLSALALITFSNSVQQIGLCFHPFPSQITHKCPVFSRDPFKKPPPETEHILQSFASCFLDRHLSMKIFSFGILDDLQAFGGTVFLLRRHLADSWGAVRGLVNLSPKFFPLFLSPYARF